MRYIQGYSLFEQKLDKNNLEDTDYIINMLETTEAGNDIKGIYSFMRNPWYRATKTGRVYFDGSPGITYIKRNGIGSWSVVQEYHSVITWEEFDTDLEKLLRIYWEKEVGKSYPEGADRKEYIKWIQNSQSILYGKGLSSDQIKNEYIKSIGAQNIITKKSLFFQEGTKYRSILDKLGYKINEKFEDNSPINTLFDYYEAWKKHSISLIPIFYFNTLSVPRIIKKTERVASHEYVRRIQIGSDNLEEAESIIINEYAKFLKKIVTNKISVNTSSVSLISEDILYVLQNGEYSPEASKILLGIYKKLLDKDIKNILKVPHQFLEEVKKANDITDDDYQMFKDFESGGYF